MPIVILIPTALCVFALFRTTVPRVFLNIYIPMFMMFPAYYFWKVASLPPIDMAEAVLLPLGIGICLRHLHQWKFAPMDLWVAVFLFSTSYADWINGSLSRTVSTFDLFASLCLALVPYMAGKLLIEQSGFRVPAIKRMVFCLFVVSIISGYEYRMGRNPFTLAIQGFFPDESFPWKTQIRWGYGRVSGPFGQSELAGMMFFFGLVLALWLAYQHLWEPKFRFFSGLPFRKSTVFTAVIAIMLLMTQARGPWIGALVAVPVALIGRSRHVLRTSLLVGACLIVGGAVFYSGIKAYTAGPTESEAQQNAQYRQALLDNYVPVAQHGGAFGWGQEFPRVLGQGSIDNEYLFIALTQGWGGLLAFCLIAAESLYYFLTAALWSPSRADRYFGFSLLGVMLGILITIFTVFLGNQPYQLFFLLAGWSQALRVKRHQPAAQVAFRRVYT